MRARTLNGRHAANLALAISLPFPTEDTGKLLNFHDVLLPRDRYRRVQPDLLGSEVSGNVRTGRGMVRPEDGSSSGDVPRATGQGSGARNLL